MKAGFSGAMLAAKFKYFDIVEYLIAVGADIDEKKHVCPLLVISVYFYC